MKRKLWFTAVSVTCTCALALVLAQSGMPLKAEEIAIPANRSGEHDLYHPARTALVNARRQLAETFRQEQDIQVQRQRVHRELVESLKLLENAEQLDPSMKGPIETLKQRIEVLESDPCASQFDGSSLKEMYDELLAEFEALIEHY